MAGEHFKFYLCFHNLVHDSTQVHLHCLRSHTFFLSLFSSKYRAPRCGVSMFLLIIVPRICQAIGYQRRGGASTVTWSSYRLIRTSPELPVQLSHFASA